MPIQRSGLQCRASPVLARRCVDVGAVFEEHSDDAVVAELGGSAESVVDGARCVCGVVGLDFLEELLDFGDGAGC